MRSRASALVILLHCLFGLAAPALAQAPAETPAAKRPVIALALSGGGARGIAHVGVLKVLEELRIPIDLIVATSAGAGTGGLYAMGYRAQEIEQLFLTTDFGAGFEDQPPRAEQSFRRKQDQRAYMIQFDVGFNDGRLQLPRGLVQGQRLLLLLNELTRALPAMDFDNLPIRYRALATDLITGEEVALSQGHLARAMHASMAIPGVFEPVELEGRLLVDGGIANNLPISLARELGADVVIAVDISAPMRSDDQLESVLDVMDQLTNILTRRNVDTQIATLGEDDILIRPELSAYSSAAFEALPEILAIGEEAARAQAEDLARYSLTPEEYEAYQSKLKPVWQENMVIDRILIDNHSHISDEFIRSHVRQRIGRPLNLKTLDEDVRRIHGLGYFGKVSYFINQTPNGNELVINAREKSWGPNYLRFGLNIEENFDGESNYNNATNNTYTALNRLGAEWVNHLAIGSEPLVYTEFYQPLSFQSSYYVTARASYRRLIVNDYDDGKTTAQYRVNRYSGSLGFGKEFSNFGRAEFRVETGRGDTEVQVGPDDLDGGDFKIGEYQFDLSYDTLDNLNFPSRGVYANLNYAMSRPAAGADKVYDRLNSSLTLALGIRRYTLSLRANTSLLLRRDGGVENAARLGGFLNLSGYNQNELTGEDAALVSLVAYRRFGRAMPYYLGASYEMGNVWLLEDSFNDVNPIHAGSLFVGIDSFVGPIILAFGYAGQNNTSLYLNIGQTF